MLRIININILIVKINLPIEYRPKIHMDELLRWMGMYNGEKIVNDL